MSGLKNFLLSLCLVGTAGLVLSYVITSYSSGHTVIRLGHDSKESSPLHQAMLLFEIEVESRTSGAVQIEIYPARQLGSVRETTELVQQGNLQMTVGASVLLTSVVPEFNVLDLFYLFRNPDHAHAALDSDNVGKVLLQAMETKGFHGLGFMEVGFRSITSNLRPITSYEDLDGLKMRAASNPAQISAWSSVGTHPTPLSWGEIFTSLQQGLINSQESSIYSIYAERFYESQRYLSLTDHTYTNYTWFANKVFWDSLSDQHRNIINQAATNAIKQQRKLAHKQNQDIIDVLEREGMTVNKVAAEVRSKMKAKMNAAVYQDLREKTGPELFDTIVRNINGV